MGTTANFVKLRSTGTPKTGEWNINYTQALELAKKNGKFIVTCWSNGDACSYCVTAETCMMTDTFKTWMKTADAYFAFQYSGDKDKGKVLHDWIFTKGKVKKYPGFRISLYDSTGKLICDKAVDGNTLRKNKKNDAGAKNIIAGIEEVFAKKPASPDKKDNGSKTGEAYKVRLNEKLTVKKVNAILDAIDKNEGYCPCQPKGDGTKCHCDDFKNSKKIGEPCICNIYVKQKKN